jgi:hypothetical protein
VVEDETQLARRLFTVDRHRLPWPLQVLGGDGSVTPPGRLDEPEERAAGRLAPEGILLGRRRRLGRCRLRLLRGSPQRNGNETDGEDE